MAGFIDEADTNTEPPTPKTCGTCRKKVSPTSRFCPNCGGPVTNEAQAEMADQNDRIFESAAQADSDNIAEAVREFRALVDEHPELRVALMEE